MLAAVLVPWGPVPGGTPEPVAPQSVLDAQQIARAEAFGAYARAVSWTSLALSILLAVALGLSRRVARAVRALPGPWPLAVLAAVAALVVAGRLLTLPFAVLLRRRRLAEGLTTQSWGGWARDLLVGQAVAIALTAAVVVALIALARRLPRAWPAVGALGAAGLVALGSFAYPLVMEPLFNDFAPLPDGDLRAQVLRLAAAEGVEVDDVLVSDASRRTTTLNAYVSGFGNTRRVVLYDTTVDGLERDALLSVVAHELAHARHHDVLRGTAIGAAGAGLGVALLALVTGAGAARRRTGTRGMGDAGVVALVLAAYAAGSFLASPVQNGISRQIEWRADVVALETTKDPDGLVALQRELAVRALTDPTPSRWGQWWFGSHPTTLERIALARRME